MVVFWDNPGLFDNGCGGSRTTTSTGDEEIDVTDIFDA